MNPNCLHCRIGALLKAYLDEKAAEGDDDARQIDRVMSDLTQVITEVLQQVPDVPMRNQLAMDAVKEIMSDTVLASIDELLSMSAVRH